MGMNGNHRTCSKSGCPICFESKGEKVILEILKKLKIKYKPQLIFKSCKNIRTLPFDFVVETSNGIKIIEYQGEQHYFPVAFNGHGNVIKQFENVKKNDKIKLEWCKEKQVSLLAIPYWEFDKIEEIIKKFVNT